MTGHTQERDSPMNQPTQPDEPIPDTQEHDPQGDVWQRHAEGDRRDAQHDREVREAMRREQHGEYDEDGNFIHSTWNPA